MVAKAPKSNPKKILQKYKKQTLEYYNGWVDAEKVADKKTALYNHSINLLVTNIKLRKKPAKIIQIYPKGLITYTYVLTMLTLSQILWLIAC